MRRPIRNYFRSALSILVILLLLVGSGCKSKKKAMEAANAEKEKARLEQQAALDRQKQEELKQREAAEKARLEAEAAAAAEPTKRLDVYFSAIANANNVNSANSSINEALSLFASPQTPVLIVISESEGQKDYDKPTRIIDYLNYLKDQKKNINKISDVKFDESGKITEIELTKQN